MRLPVLVVLWGIWVGTCPAVEYANVDSITVHGLTYIGGIDGYEYGFTDSIRVIYRITNRSSRAESLRVTGECTPVLVRELWCDSVPLFCEFSPELRSCSSPWPPMAWIRIITPGEHILAEFSVAARYTPEPNWLFRTGTVGFYNPWPPQLPFAFYLHYVRRVDTMVSVRSWSRIKSLYR